jgi:hypothetical protein
MPPGVGGPPRGFGRHKTLIGLYAGDQDHGNRACRSEVPANTPSGFACGLAA